MTITQQVETDRYGVKMQSEVIWEFLTSAIAASQISYEAEWQLALLNALLADRTASECQALDMQSLDAERRFGLARELSEEFVRAHHAPAD